MYVYIEDADSNQWVQPVAGNIFSGDYNDLSNKPTIFDGNYSSLVGAPTIPTSLTDLGISDGSSTQVLTTDGAGNFTFEDAAGGSSFDQNLNTTDSVTFASISSPTFLNSGTGVTNLTSASTLTLQAVDAVVVTGAPFRLPSFTNTQRDALTASNGDMIYNTDDNKIQSYINGVWRRLDDSGIV